MSNPIMSSPSSFSPTLISSSSIVPSNGFSDMSSSPFVPSSSASDIDNCGFGDGGFDNIRSWSFVPTTDSSSRSAPTATTSSSSPSSSPSTTSGSSGNG